MASLLFATYLTTQQARSPWVGFVFSETECMGHGLSSSSSRTVLGPTRGLFFFYMGSCSGNRRGYMHFARACTSCSIWVDSTHICCAFQVLSMAQSLRTRSDNSVKLCTWRWAGAFKIPSSWQLYRKVTMISWSQQYAILSLTRRNLAEKWWTVSLSCCFMNIKSHMSGFLELLEDTRRGGWVGKNFVPQWVAYTDH